MTRAELSHENPVAEMARHREFREYMAQERERIMGNLEAILACTRSHRDARTYEDLAKRWGVDLRRLKSIVRIYRNRHSLTELTQYELPPQGGRGRLAAAFIPAELANWLAANATVPKQRKFATEVMEAEKAAEYAQEISE